jgi:hypothetical protein
LPAVGYDGQRDGAATMGAQTLFRSPTRSGLDQLHLGLVYAALSQKRNNAEPTWKLGVEFRASVGEMMRLDAANPGASTGVSTGLHELRLWTSLAKRAAFAIPYFEMWWMAAVGHRGNSAFAEPPDTFGAQRTGAMQQAGTHFGLEAVMWERPERGYRIGVNLSGSLSAHFEGRDFSEMWEVFQLAGNPAGGGPLVLDADPVTPGVQPLAHPGISNVQNYLTFDGGLSVAAVLARLWRLEAGFGVRIDQSHLITFADAGDKPVVTPGTADVNPFYVPLIDLTGHRYRVSDATGLWFSFSAQFFY